MTMDAYVISLVMGDRPERPVSMRGTKCWWFTGYIIVTGERA